MSVNEDVAEQPSPPLPTARPSLPGRSRVAPAVGAFWLLVAAGLGLIVTIIAADLDRRVVGLLTVLLTLFMLALGIHVAVAMALSGLFGLWKITGLVGVEQSLMSIPHHAVASWSLTVLPMFVLMGLVLYRTGITGRLFDAVRQWFGHIPGGLALSTNFAGAGLAAASGSTMGIAFALGRIAIPEMLKAGYAPSLSTAVVAMAGTIGQIIPPSILMVIYAGTAQTAVGPQLLAGLIPGVLLACMFGAMIAIRAALNRDLAPPIDTSSFTWDTRIRSLGGVWPLPVLIVVVIGGMYAGVATATEAGALGAFVAMLIGVWAGRKGGIGKILKELGSSLADTAAAVAAIMFLLVSVHLLNRIVTISGLGQEIARIVTGLGLGRIGLLFGMIVLYLVLGMFMDTLAMMLLTIPIFIPLLEAQQVDLIWFGVFIVLMAEIAMVTPPVGVLAFVVHGLAQNKDVNLGHRITLGDVFRGASWFVLTALVLVVLLILFPDIALWLPNSSSSSP